MYVPRWNSATLHETSKFTDICKQTFRNPKFVEDEKTRKEGFEVGFGILSEFNSHLERVKTMEKKEMIELRKLSPNIQVPIKVLDEEMTETESDVFRTASDSMADMKDDERLQKFSSQTHNQDKLDGSDMYLVLTEKPRKNHLLVAHPLLEDTRFERTVVRMDNDKQTLGYIIGKLTFESEQDEEDNNDNEENIAKLMGEDSLDKESSRDTDHVMDAYKQFSKMFAQDAIENEPERIGKWYEGQLENEIRDGKWIVVEADMESILPFGAETPYYQVWEYIVKRLSGEYLSWLDYFSHKQPTPLKRPNTFPNVRIIVL